jgi:hypothetical protein
MGLHRCILLLVSICAAISSAGSIRPKTEREKQELAEAMRPIGMHPDHLLDQIPMDSVRFKLYKLKAFNNAVHKFLEDNTSDKAAAVLIVFFYLVASYIPALSLAAMLGCCRKSEMKALPPSGFVFNQQDMNDI